MVATFAANEPRRAETGANMERKNTRGEAPPEGVGVWARREMEGSPGWDEAVWRQTEEREEAFLVPALKTEALSTHFAKVTSRFVLVRSSSRTKLEVDACPRRPTRLLLIAESRLPCGAGAAERIVIQLMTSDRKLRRPERARNEGSTGPKRGGGLRQRLMVMAPIAAGPFKTFRAYSNASLIRNCPPPRTTVGP